MHEANRKFKVCQYFSLLVPVFNFLSFSQGGDYWKQVVLSNKIKPINIGLVYEIAFKRLQGLKVCGKLFSFPTFTEVLSVVKFLSNNLNNPPLIFPWLSRTKLPLYCLKEQICILNVFSVFSTVLLKVSWIIFLSFFFYFQVFFMGCNEIENKFVFWEDGQR